MRFGLIVFALFALSARAELLCNYKLEAKDFVRIKSKKVFYIQPEQEQPLLDEISKSLTEAYQAQGIRLGNLHTKIYHSDKVEILYATIASTETFASYDAMIRDLNCIQSHLSQILNEQKNVFANLLHSISGGNGLMALRTVEIIRDVDPYLSRVSSARGTHQKIFDGVTQTQTESLGWTIGLELAVQKTYLTVDDN